MCSRSAKEANKHRRDLTTLFTLRFITESMKRDARKRSASPIFSDFFVCSSLEEVREVIEESDLPPRLFNGALITDHTSRELRFLVYVCPGCTGADRVSFAEKVGLQ